MTMTHLLSRPVPATAPADTTVPAGTRAPADRQASFVALAPVDLNALSDAELAKLLDDPDRGSDVRTALVSRYQGLVRSSAHHYLRPRRPPGAQAVRALLRDRRDQAVLPGQALADPGQPHRPGAVPQRQEGPGRAGCGTGRHAHRRAGRGPPERHPAGAAARLPGPRRLRPGVAGRPGLRLGRTRRQRPARG